MEGSCVGLEARERLSGRRRQREWHAPEPELHKEQDVATAAYEEDLHDGVVE